MGTARFSAMAGAYGGLGADFTALSYNPAGIGFYQFSELIFTPQFLTIPLLPILLAKKIRMKVCGLIFLILAMWFPLQKMTNSGKE